MHLRTAATAALLLALSASGAAAQHMSSNSSAMNAGYGRTAGQDNRFVEGAVRSADGNRLIVDGVIQTGEDNLSYSRQGVLHNGRGAGYGQATAIGNSLNVVVQGNRNTVVVNSRQINNGDIIAGVTQQQPANTLNGELDLDDDGL